MLVKFHMSDLTKTISYRGAAGFLDLADEWDQLAGQGITNTPFQTLAYQRAWWTHLCPADSELLTIATRNNDGKLLGIGCFYFHDGKIYFNGGIEETDYLDLIVGKDHADSVWRATIRHLQDQEQDRLHTLDLYNIPETSPSRAILRAIAEEHEHNFNESIIEVCPVIELLPSFDAYLETLDSKQRRELNRKLRRAEAADVITTIVGPADNIQTEVDSFLDLLQKSTFEKRDWLNDDRRALFHDVARHALQAGTLQLMFTSIEGRRAAALFNFDYDDRIWVYNSGLDPAAFSALSPGVVLTATAIEKAIALGRKEFDFLRGNEEYKYRFGAVDTNIYRVQIEMRGRRPENA